MASIVPKKWTRTVVGKDGVSRKAERTGWQVQIRLKGFPAVIETFERKTDAKEWAQRTEAAMKEGRYFPDAASKKKTLADLVDRYVADVCPEKKSGDKQARQLEWWKAEHGFRVLAELTPEVLVEARDKLLRAKGPTGKKLSGATVNRYLAALSHALTMASKEWGWIRDNPMRRVTRRKEPRGRVRFLSDAERGTLLAACRAYPIPYLYPMVVLALSTGMRQGEIIGLRWKDVDLKRKHVVLGETKNGERRGLPLVGESFALVSELSKVRVLGDDRVFLEGSKVGRHFKRVVEGAGIPDFHFHDLRHTAASYMAMNGATTSEIAAVLGHKTLMMVKRYSHLHDEHLADVVGRMNARFLGPGSRD